MAKEDKEKTSFIMPGGVYRYVCMPFGLKNAGATFQWHMRTLVEDLEETFANIRKVNIKLNHAKCVFGVLLGKLLGFLVSHRGIQENHNKVKAIKEMCPPVQPQGDTMPRGVHGGASLRGARQRLGPSSSS
jgi:hypothetical protein